MIGTGGGGCSSSGVSIRTFVPVKMSVSVRLCQEEAGREAQEVVFVLEGGGGCSFSSVSVCSFVLVKQVN
jgi:hypothetical protein